MAKARLEEIREIFAENKGGYVQYHRDEYRGFAYLGLMQEANNLITGKMMLDLEIYIENLSKWKVGKAVVVYAGNKNFCLGVDQKFSAENLNPAFAQDLSHYMTTILLKLSKMPLVSVCLLTGVTEGLGSEIALYCDYVLMQNTATISFNHASMAITPGLGGAKRLIDSVGKKICMDLLLTCRVLTAKMAKKLKIVDEILYEERPMDGVNRWLYDKFDKGAIIVQSIKIICSCSGAANQSVLERNTFSLLWSHHAHADALNTLLPISSSDESHLSDLSSLDEEADENADVVSEGAVTTEEEGSVTDKEQNQ